MDDHDATCVRNLPPPTPLMTNDRLVVHGNSLLQLNVVPPPDAVDARLASLYDVVDRCVTPEGRHELRVRLCNPSSDADAIARRLDLVDAVSKDQTGLHDALRTLGGLGRAIAKLRVARLTPTQLLELGAMADRIHRTFVPRLRTLAQTDDALGVYCNRALPDDVMRDMRGLAADVALALDEAGVRRAVSTDVERVSYFKVGFDADIDRLVGRSGDILGYLRTVVDRLRAVLPASRRVGAPSANPFDRPRRTSRSRPPSRRTVGTASTSAPWASGPLSPVCRRSGPCACAIRSRAPRASPPSSTRTATARRRAPSDRAGTTRR